MCEECDDEEAAKDEGRDGCSAGPGVLCAAPLESENYKAHAENEKKNARPVNAEKASEIVCSTGGLGRC